MLKIPQSLDQSLETLRAAWLFHHQARTALAQPMRFARMAHRTTPPLLAIAEREERAFYMHAPRDC